MGLHTARLTVAFGWIFQHPQSPLVPPGSNTPIVGALNATLNHSQNPTRTPHSAGSVLNHTAPFVATSLSPTSTLPQGEQLDLTLSRQVWLPNQAPITGSTPASTLGHKAAPHVIPPPRSQQNRPLTQAARTAEIHPLDARRCTPPMRADPPHVPIKRQESLPQSPLAGPNGEVAPRHNSPRVPVGMVQPASTQSGLLGTPSSSSLSLFVPPSGASRLEAPASAFLPTDVVDLGQGQIGEGATPPLLSLRTAAAGSSSPVFGSLKPLQADTAHPPENWGSTDVSVPLKMEEGTAGESQNLNLQEVSSEASPASIQVSQPAHSGAAISGAPKSSSTATASPRHAAASHTINAALALTGMGASSSVPQSPLVPDTATALSAPAGVTGHAMPTSESMQTSTSVYGARDALMDVCAGHATAIAQSAVNSAVNAVAESATAHATMALNEGRGLSDIIGTGNATHRQQDSIEEGEILELPTVSPERGIFAPGGILPATGVRGSSGGAGGEPDANQDLMKTRVVNRDLNYAGPYPHSGGSFVFVETQPQASSHLAAQEIADPKLRTNVSSHTMDISDDEVDQLLQDRASVSPQLNSAARELDTAQPMVCLGRLHINELDLIVPSVALQA